MNLLNRLRRRFFLSFMRRKRVSTGVRLYSQEQLELAYSRGESANKSSAKRKGRREGLKTGMAEGKTQGYEKGYKEGVEEGGKTGYDKGYTVGYNNGINDGESKKSRERYKEGVEVGKISAFTKEDAYKLGYNEGKRKTEEELRKKVNEALDNGELPRLF